MSNEAISGTASEREGLISNPESREVSTVPSDDDEYATDSTGRRPARARHASEGDALKKDDVPQFLHLTVNERAQQQAAYQQQQHDYASPAPPWHHHGNANHHYAEYPYSHNGVAAPEASNTAPTGYGAIPPVYSQQNPYYSPQPPPLYAYYSAPPHQYADHPDSANAANAQMYYGGPYSSMGHPMMWSQGSTGSGRPPTVPSRSRGSTDKKASGHRRARPSSPLGTDRKIPEYEQLNTEAYLTDEVEHDLLPSEKQQHREEANHRRVRSSSPLGSQRKLVEHEVPLYDEDPFVVDSVPFLGRYGDGTSYGTAPRTKQQAGSLDKLHHRRVRSAEPTVGTSLVRFKDGQGYGATSSATSTGTSTPTSAQQHPLLRKPRHPANFNRDAYPLERNVSFEDLRRARKKPPGVHRRVSSETGLPPVGPMGRHHRRNSSRSSTGLGEFSRRLRADSASSVVSYASTVSIVTDITKSALFGGVTESGLVKFHLPLDNVSLIMDSELKPGTIFKNRDVDEEEHFAEYHIMTAESSNHWQDLLDDDGLGGCTCQCDNCLHCTSRAELLPTPRYALVVEDDVYRRVLKEISDAKYMPCGLFFCGHHEDVSHPSIFIAVGIVLLFICGMVIVALV